MFLRLATLDDERFRGARRRLDETYASADIATKASLGDSDGRQHQCSVDDLTSTVMVLLTGARAWRQNCKERRRSQAKGSQARAFGQSEQEHEQWQRGAPITRSHHSLQQPYIAHSQRIQRRAGQSSSSWELASWAATKH